MPPAKRTVIIENRLKRQMQSSKKRPRNHHLRKCRRSLGWAPLCPFGRVTYQMTAKTIVARAEYIVNMRALDKRKNFHDKISSREPLIPRAAAPPGGHTHFQGAPLSVVLQPMHEAMDFSTASHAPACVLPIRP